MTYGLPKSCKEKSRFYLNYLKNPTDIDKKNSLNFTIVEKTKIAVEKLYYAI